MHGIDHFNLKSFDLNLMLAFDALVAERSVTRAAQRLRVGQPAMSHALSSLRLLLGDDLLVRVKGVMEPTPRAVSLAQPIRDLLLTAQETLLSRPLFDPATEKRTFRIGLSDQLEALLIPALISRLRHEAQSVVVVTKPTSREQVFGMIDEGAIDFAVGSFPEGPSWSRRSLLYEERHVCCFSPKQTGFSAPIPLHDYLNAAHAVVSKSSNLLGYLEGALSRASISPNVVVTTTNFFSLLLLAVDAPVITTVPLRMAERFAQSLHLTASALPFALEALRVELIWHQRTDADAASSWFRNMMDASATTLVQSGGWKCPSSEGHLAV